MFFIYCQVEIKIIMFTRRLSDIVIMIFNVIVFNVLPRSLVMPGRASEYNLFCATSNIAIGHK